MVQFYLNIIGFQTMGDTIVPLAFVVANVRVAP